MCICVVCVFHYMWVGVYQGVETFRVCVCVRMFHYMRECVFNNVWKHLGSVGMFHYLRSV